MDESGGTEPYRAVETLAWTTAEEKTGKTVKLKGFAGADALENCLFHLEICGRMNSKLLGISRHESDDSI
ncbi:MAG: hypothetical protein WKF71_19370 [Pyrinomonadaceae bacterium]